MSDYSNEVNKRLIGLKKGKEGSFDRLFELTANHMRGVAFGILKNDALVDDAVLQAFERIYRYIHTYDGKISGLAWMYTVVRNVCRDIIEEESVQRGVESLEIAAALDKAPAFDIDTRLDMFAAMKELDEDDREFLRMRFYAGMTLIEIGAKTGMTKAAASKRMKRILADMKDLMKQD